MGKGDYEYSAKSEDLILGFNMAASVLSFFGASFVFWNFWKFENLRTFAFKLVFFVAIGDMINCIGNFMGSPNGGGLCVLQAITIQFGDVVSFLWVTAIAWIIQRVLTGEANVTGIDAQKLFRRMHAVIWPTAVTFSVLPFIGNTYGESGGFCWIKRSSMGNIWRLLCLYVPLWLCFAYIVFVYAKVWISVATADSHKQPPEMGTAATQPPAAGTSEPPLEFSTGMMPSPMGAPNSMHFEPRSVDPTAEETPDKSTGSTLSRIKYYPLVLFVNSLFPTIRRLVEASTHKKAHLSLAIMHVVATSSIGFWNALVYGLTPSVRATDGEFFKNLCGKK